MAEAELWRDLQTRVAPLGRLKRVENACDKGTPDVSYLLRRYPTSLPPVAGWLELKHRDGWPREQFFIKSLTKEQVMWQEDWRDGGGQVFTLIRVLSAHILVNPATLRAIHERTLYSEEVIERAVRFWHGPYNVGELIRCLTAT